MAGLLQGYAKVSVAEFAQSLAESGLLDASDVLPDFVPSAAAGGAAAAQQLIDYQKLTGYQAEAVLARRFGDLRVGNYEILDRIGAGGMGTVFKARHRRMKRIVALKVLSKAAAAGKMAERFQREVETIARLTHPNIVMAFDADEAEAGPFLVMEFVNGRDLASEVTDSGPLSVADAIDRILQAARGLEYAHAQGIVHRDIKPGNIIRDADGVVKVADLGLARLNAPEGSGGLAAMTQAGSVFGTAEYMPPEQAIDAGKVDHRADIYSLGCTLYFLLTGRPMYPAESLMSALLKHRDDPIPDLRAARPGVPAELEAVFRRMVAKAPGDRHPTMTEVVKDLERVQSQLGRADQDTGFWDSPLAGPKPRVEKTAVFDRVADAGSPQDTSWFEVSPAPAVAPPPSPAERVVGLTVVLAESSRTQAGIIRRYLTQLGAGAVHTTGTGREALELARRERASVIVSSMHLTDMTGAQLATALLADPGCAAVGFVLATSEADSQEPGAIPESPRVVVMPKPFDPERLARSIAAVVGT
jgi:serine/threonine protein kinase